MLDNVAMITFLGIYIILLFISLFMYLVIVGANKNKTDEERSYEDEEQMNYLKIIKREVKLMNKLPGIITKNQAISYAIIAFNNFINSGNTSCFDVSTIETFYTGAMETHDKSSVVNFANNLKANNKKKVKIKVEEIGM